MQCYCGAGEDHLPFLYREFSDKREVRLFLFWESVVQAEKNAAKDQSIKVENEYYIVKYANYADWYNVIILLMKDNWLLAISYKIFL